MWRETGDPTLEAPQERLKRAADQRRVPAGDGSARRIVGRRRALPSARALLGGFLVGAAALVVFAAVLNGAGGRAGGTYVVAARTLTAGSVIEPEDLSTNTMRLPSSVAGAAFGDPARLVGRTVAVPVGRGELLEASMLTTGASSPEVRPVTVAVDPASLGVLIPGQPVDVLEATGGGGSGSGSATVSVVVRGATLLGLSRGSSGLLSNPSAETVTVGVSTLQEVEAVIAASHAGTLTLVAAEPSDGVGPGEVATGGAAGAGG